MAKEEGTQYHKQRLRPKSHSLRHSKHGCFTPMELLNNDAGRVVAYITSTRIPCDLKRRTTLNERLAASTTVLRSSLTSTVMQMACASFAFEFGSNTTGLIRAAAYTERLARRNRRFRCLDPHSRLTVTAEARARTHFQITEQFPFARAILDSLKVVGRVMRVVRLVDKNGRGRWNKVRCALVHDVGIQYRVLTRAVGTAFITSLLSS